MSSWRYPTLPNTPCANRSQRYFHATCHLHLHLFGLALPQARESNERIWDIGKVYFYLFLELRTIPTPRRRPVHCIQPTFFSFFLCFSHSSFPSRSPHGRRLSLHYTSRLTGKQWPKLKMILKQAMNSFVRTEKAEQIFERRPCLPGCQPKISIYPKHTQPSTARHSQPPAQQEWKEGQAVFPVDFCNQAKIAFASCLFWIYACRVRSAFRFFSLSQSKWRNKFQNFVTFLCFGGKLL